MNENLNLVEILKDCPKGTKLYSTIWGYVKFNSVSTDSLRPINVEIDGEIIACIANDGKLEPNFDGECTLFPSRDQRDWSKFKPKQSKFDPKTLQPFDRVITKCGGYPWKCNIFSYYVEREDKRIDCYCTSDDYIYDKCIPYNDETKHLVGTYDGAPEFYRYWEE